MEEEATKQMEEQALTAAYNGSSASRFLFEAGGYFPASSDSYPYPYPYPYPTDETMGSYASPHYAAAVAGVTSYHGGRLLFSDSTAVLRRKLYAATYRSLVGSDLAALEDASSSEDAPEARYASPQDASPGYRSGGILRRLLSRLLTAEAKADSEEVAPLTRSEETRYEQ
jgi:hypothetical protein